MPHRADCPEPTKVLPLQAPPSWRIRSSPWLTAQRIRPCPASAAGILLAHGIITRDQHTAAGDYHRCYSLTFGDPWHRPTGPDGRQATDEALEKARLELDAMVAVLDHDQKKRELDHVVISNWLPQWFYSANGIGRALATDETRARRADPAASRDWRGCEKAPALKPERRSASKWGVGKCCQWQQIQETAQI